MNSNIPYTQLPVLYSDSNAKNSNATIRFRRILTWDSYLLASVHDVKVRFSLPLSHQPSVSLIVGRVSTDAHPLSGTASIISSSFGTSHHTARFRSLCHSTYSRISIRKVAHLLLQVSSLVDACNTSTSTRLYRYLSRYSTKVQTDSQIRIDVPS